MEEKPKKSTAQHVYNYSSLGVQTVGMIGGGAYLGSWLDEKYAFEKPWFTLVLVLGFTAIAIYLAIKRLNKWQKD